MAWHKLVLAAAAVVLMASCAVAAGMRNEVIAGFCGVRPGEVWSRIEPPADAEVFRQRAWADPAVANRRPRGDEYWFTKPGGEVRFCITPLERGAFVASRNRTGCEERIGSWWDFRRMDDGPTTDGVAEHICVT